MRTQDTVVPPIESDELASFNLLVGEVSALFHQLKLVADEVHHQGAMSGARRSVLRGLDQQGAQTVPEIARLRNVTRQHVQTIINELMADGYVELEANPAHKKSALVRLTPLGQKTVTAMNRREARLLSRAEHGLTPERMRAAARTMRQLREFFAGDSWQRLLKQSR